MQRLVEAHKRKEDAAKQRLLEIFMQLLELKPFQEWMQDNIVIRDEVDHDKKMITTYVIYKGDLSEEDRKLIERETAMAQSDWWCKKCDKGFFSPDIEKSDENRNPLCPECGEVVVDALTAQREEKEANDNESKSESN